MKKILALAAFAAVVSTPSVAQVNVGVIVSTTGPGASLGISYKSTFNVVPKTLGGMSARYIIMDDATDPTNAIRHARKLISEDNVDLIIGSGTLPAATAIAQVAEELNTPQLSLSPADATTGGNRWIFSVPQPVGIMMGAVADRMKADGVRRMGYIGFSDSWGEMVLSGLAPHLKANGIELVADERYARLDTSVLGQVLKLIAAKPDAVVVGGSSVPAALPQLALREHGYQGKIYHTHGVINKDFLRVAGKSAEGAIAPTGPVAVTEQLPDSNPIKKVALEFVRAYEDKYGAGKGNTFAAAYSWDAYLLADRAVAAASAKARPGTAEFRHALRDALETNNGVVGTHAVYNYTPTDHSGVDERARVLVRVENGNWKLVK